MNVKFSDFVSGSLNSTGFIVGYDSATNSNIRISKSTLDSIYQSKLTLTTTGSSGAATLIGSTLNIPQYSGGGGGGGVTQIVAGTNVTISPAGGTGAVTINASGGGGGSQVGYRGFKYTITAQFEGETPNPLPGQAVAYFPSDGEGGTYYSGLYINRVDADGTLLDPILNKLPNFPFQPFVLINTAGVKSVNELTSVGYSASSFILGGTDAPNYGTFGGIYYLHFSTSNTAPAYTGYTIHGHLNSTPVPTGTFFIAPGSSTLGTTFNSRVCQNVQAASGYVYSWIQTESVMTGTMVVQTFRNGFGFGGTLTIASGSAAAIYNVASSSFVGPGSCNLSLRITQTVLPSCNILGFGFRAV